MNLDDARTVLKWLGYDVKLILPADLRWSGQSEESLDFAYFTEKHLDANRIFREVVPALEERLGINSVTWYSHRSGTQEVIIRKPGRTLSRATGPTFEAAMISATAKAVRG